MMRILFVASAVADLSKVGSAFDGVNGNSLQEAILDTLDHMSNGDCKKLKSFLTPKLKESLKRTSKLVEEVGKVASESNPMISPMISMATGYLTTSGNSVIDNIVKMYACQFMIDAVPEEVRKVVLPKLRELIGHLDDPEKCEDLQKFVIDAGVPIKQAASDLADHVAAHLQEVEEFDKESMTPFVAMVKKYFLRVIDEKLNEFIDSHLCPFVYQSHDEL